MRSTRSGTACPSRRTRTQRRSWTSRASRPSTRSAFESIPPSADRQSRAGDGDPDDRRRRCACRAATTARASRSASSTRVSTSTIRISVATAWPVLRSRTPASSRSSTSSATRTTRTYSELDTGPRPDRGRLQRPRHARAGIVGANGGAIGVAPGVKFGAYRVFGCAGSANDDVILAALEQAYADGMDVVNMSLGDAFNTWPEAPLAQASDTLLKNGVVVVASIGNSGTSGVYSPAPPALATASSASRPTTTRSPTSTRPQLPAGNHHRRIHERGRRSARSVSGSLPFVEGDCRRRRAAWRSSRQRWMRGRTCGGLPTGCSCAHPARHMRLLPEVASSQAGGASAVVAVQQRPPNCSRHSVGTVGPLGADGISGHRSDRRDLGRKGLRSTTQSPRQRRKRGTGPPARVSTPEPTGGTISSFSSFGLNAELTLKPDIGAPGGFIRSTYPLELGHVCQPQRYVDGVPACGRCSGAAAPGESGHEAG